MNAPTDIININITCVSDGRQKKKKTGVHLEFTDKVCEFINQMLM